MNRAQKKKATVLGGLGLFLFAFASRARGAGKGTVHIGPVTVREDRLNLGPVLDAKIKRFSLALTESKRMLGADPNTLVSRKPEGAELSFVRETIDLGHELAAQSEYVPPPTELERMLALAIRLPGDELSRVNARFYALLGIDPRGDNEPSLPLTPAREAEARSLIAKWRPYSEDAVGTLYAQLDFARELGGSA